MEQSSLRRHSRPLSPTLLPLTWPHMHTLHDQAAFPHMTWHCTSSLQVPTVLTGRWENTICTLAAWWVESNSSTGEGGWQGFGMKNHPPQPLLNLCPCLRCFGRRRWLKRATQAKSIIPASCLQFRGLHVVTWGPCLPLCPLGTFGQAWIMSCIWDHPQTTPSDAAYHTCTRWWDTK